MALDRQTIEKRDFPVGRRGYEIAAVDSHLQMLADEFDALARASRRTSPRHDVTLAQSASEQVRLIVEAAEQSAAEIRREAGREAGEHVQRVSAAAQAMLERIERMQRELAEQIEALRAGTSKVGDELSQLSASVREVGAAPTAAPAAPEPVAELEPAGAPEAEPEPEPAVAEEPEGAGGADEEGARLIALNMALNGTPRDETERYLADNFELADPQGLLDDVYARAGQ